MTRRNLFQALAGIPILGRLTRPGLAQLQADGEIVWTSQIVTDPPITHYVGFGLSINPPSERFRQYYHSTLAEAMEHVVPGRGDTIVVAPTHHDNQTFGVIHT